MDSSISQSRSPSPEPPKGPSRKLNIHLPLAGQSQPQSVPTRQQHTCLPSGVRRSSAVMLATAPERDRIMPPETTTVNAPDPAAQAPSCRECLCRWCQGEDPKMGHCPGFSGGPVSSRGSLQE